MATVFAPTPASTRRGLHDQPVDQSTDQSAPWSRRRLAALVAAAALVFAVYFVQLANITLVHGEENRTLADSYLFRPNPLAAPRGLIVARDGTILASNRLVYAVTFSRLGLSREEIAQTLDGLEPLFPATVARWRETLKQRGRLPRRIETLASGLTVREVAPLAERLADLPGVSLQERFERHYPVTGAGLGHVLGYVTEINLRGLRRLMTHWGEDTSAVAWDAAMDLRETANLLEAHGYALGDKVGVAGLEFVYERDLRGQKGLEQILQDAFSQIHGWTVTRRAVPGHTLHLTLDLKLQRLGLALLAGRRGAMIAMDPRDGAVLALVSSPAFDSDQPVTNRGWAALNTDSVNRPLVNRAIREVYSPGSTLKPFVALGALRTGAIEPGTEFACGGTFTVGSAVFRCDYRGGCGTLDLRRALRRSCNIYFYNTARRLGQDAWHQTLAAFGFFSPTAIDLPGENPGHAPPRDVYPGELVQLGIGQGPFDVTPLQMVTAYARLAVNRRDVVPHLVDRAVDASGATVWTWAERHGSRATSDPQREDPPLPDLAPEHRRAVLEALADVTRAQEGTAFRAQFPPEWRVAGKTGTAQNRGAIDAWFIAFAPMEAPEIVVGCVVEGGGHGADAAAPLVREMMAAYFAETRAAPLSARPPVLGPGAQPSEEGEGAPGVASRTE